MDRLIRWVQEQLNCEDDTMSQAGALLVLVSQVLRQHTVHPGLPGIAPDTMLDDAHRLRSYFSKFELTSWPGGELVLNCMSGSGRSRTLSNNHVRALLGPLWRAALASEAVSPTGVLEGPRKLIDMPVEDVSRSWWKLSAA